MGKLNYLYEVSVYARNECNAFLHMYMQMLRLQASWSAVDFSTWMLACHVYLLAAKKDDIFDCKQMFI